MNVTTEQTTPTVRGLNPYTVGPRGASTYARLLDALEKALATTPWRRIKVIDIARDAGLSPAAFYQYFADIEDAFADLVADRTSAGEPPTEHMRLISALLAWRAA